MLLIPWQHRLKFNVDQHELMCIVPLIAISYVFYLNLLTVKKNEYLLNIKFWGSFM